MPRELFENHFQRHALSGQRFTASRKMRVATLTAGYGDGYLSSAATSAVRGGKRCAVLGRITMDQMLVDVSCVPGVQCGDEAVDPAGTKTITANQLAEWAGTIPWETLTAITHRVPARTAEGRPLDPAVSMSFTVPVGGEPMRSRASWELR